MSKVFCVVSENDNIGKSYLALSIASQCVSSKDSRLLIIELATGEKDIASYLDVDDEVIYDVCDVINGICDIDQSLIEIDENIDYLPVSRVKSKIKDISKAKISNFIINMKREYDYILVEVNNLSYNYFIDYSLFNKIMYMTDNNFSSVKHILSSKAIFSEIDKSKIIYLFNKCEIEKSNYRNKLSVNDVNILLHDYEIIYVSKLESILDFDYNKIKSENLFNEVLKKI